MSVTFAAFTDHQRRAQGAEAGPKDPQPAYVHEPSGLRGVNAAAGRQLLAAAAPPPFTVSPAQSGVRVDSPELRMNGAPTQLFQIDFGKATVELNPIKLFTITGAVECALMITSDLLEPTSAHFHIPDTHATLAITWRAHAQQARTSAQPQNSRP